MQAECAGTPPSSHARPTYYYRRRGRRRRRRLICHSFSTADSLLPIQTSTHTENVYTRGGRKRCTRVLHSLSLVESLYYRVCALHVCPITRPRQYRHSLVVYTRRTCRLHDCHHHHPTQLLLSVTRAHTCVSVSCLCLM